MKKHELDCDNIISKGKAENHRKFTPLIFDLNKKNKTTNFFLLHIVFRWFLYLGKNIKPITTLRGLVGHHGSLSNMNLKYHVSIQCKDSIPIVSCVWSWNNLLFHLLSGFRVMWYIYNKFVLYLIKAIKNQNVHRGTKMLYHWEATSIKIPSISLLKAKEILKWFMDLEKVCPYMEIKQNKKEFPSWNN